MIGSTFISILSLKVLTWRHVASKIPSLTSSKEIMKNAKQFATIDLVWCNRYRISLTHVFNPKMNYLHT